MNFTMYIEEEKKKNRLSNIKQLREEINQNWVSEKIENHIQRFNGMFSKEEIIKEILENDIVASFFIKDPGRQNIGEKLAAKVLKIKKLPSQGKNCIRFNDSGDIVFEGQKGYTKSADFFYNGYYTTQKYTDISGGSQDNQMNDVIDFLKRGSIKNKVAAIVDGNYWDSGNREKLKELFNNNPNVMITSVTEITSMERD